MAISNGVWFDTKNSKVVDKAPEEGIQIVAPGTEETSATEADVQPYRDIEAGVVREPETITSSPKAKSPKAAEDPPAA